MKKALPVFIVFLCSMVVIPAVAGQTPPAQIQGIDLTRQQWNGDAIAYSGYRGEENPDKGLYPTRSELLEDMNILSRHWHLLRVYGSDKHSEDLLRVVRENHFPVKVMLGVWLTGAARHEADNEKQIASAIELARKYSDIVVAVSVGNEALVTWSDHKMTEQQVISVVERVREALHCPVTVADDFLYWVRPDAALVEHVDFITLHTYPVWGRQDIDTGLSSTIANYEKVRQSHPGKTIVLGEVGWPSYTVGEMHAPRAGDEHKQKQYFDQITAWAKTNKVTAFLFEAFDEPWKGPGTEGHWGLFSGGRKAKLVMQELYPELKPNGPTSPSYDDLPAKVSK